MSANWDKMQSSRLGRSYATFISSATTSTTPFSAQIRQLRVSGSLPVYVTVGVAATVTATNAAYIPANWVEHLTCSPTQVLNYISTSTSSGTLTLSEMLWGKNHQTKNLPSDCAPSAASCYLAATNRTL
jgi:hypothetical protein